MAAQSIAQFPIIKGVVASNQPLAQPKGSVSRVSNLIMTSRGALTPVDGSGIINAYNDLVQTAEGKFLAEILFDPTGVAPYYLALVQDVHQPLGPPKNLTLANAGPGSTLAAGTYFYVVTALDGRGGETTISNEASIAIGLNDRVQLTWNVVPNAYGYNVYRGTAPGAELSLVGSALPVLQPLPLSLTVTFIDTGFQAGTSFAVVTAISSPGSVPAPFRAIGWTISTPASLSVGMSFVASGMAPAGFNGTYTITVILSPTSFSTAVGAAPLGTTGTGGTVLIGGVSPPLVDTTTQTALVLMPTFKSSWNEADVVALFPATVPGLNVPPNGGAGGGTSQATGTPASTVNGGIQGMVSLTPMFKQFTNRMVIALGNGYAPQLFSDASGTSVNPAFVGTISAINGDAFGVVTITTATPHGLDATQALGANVKIAGVPVPAYNSNGHGASVFEVIQIPSTTSVKVRNLNAALAGATATGTMTVTTVPLVSTFVPAFPPWTASTVLATGDIIVPVTQPSPAIYLTVIQGGTTGTVEPTWPTGGLDSIGRQVADNTVRYQVSGLLNSAAPAPPGASHIEVFSGLLWVFNTWYTNTTNGLDGPTSLRQSGVNNPNSWNPINQAFLDKDDGSEGMGLAKFTITAQGIPPEGSLIAMKNWSPYQIIGVFGAANFQIQAVSSDMGCIAPRTLIFVPGFGIMRYSHLGFANFNGVKDEIISEQVRPYEFPDTNRNFADITAVDANWVPLSWAALTANPPQYGCAMPVGDSNGELTRIFLYDLVLKGWDFTDLPFSISSMAQVRSTVSNPLTIIGGFRDGAMQRWQAGDLDWYTPLGNTSSGAQVPVQWSFTTQTVASQDTDQRVYARRLVITGTNSGPIGRIGVDVSQSGVLKATLKFLIPADSDFDIDCSVGLTGKRFDARVYSVIGAPSNPLDVPTNFEIDGVTWEIEPRPAGVVVAV